MSFYVYESRIADQNTEYSQFSYPTCRCSIFVQRAALLTDLGTAGNS